MGGHSSVFHSIPSTNFVKKNTFQSSQHHDIMIINLIVNHNHYQRYPGALLAKLKSVITVKAVRCRPRSKAA